MEDKTFQTDDGRPRFLKFDPIQDPASRKEFEEMEETLRELEYFNRKAEEELRRAGLL
jgi:hypothetical protein